MRSESTSRMGLLLLAAVICGLNGVGPAQAGPASQPAGKEGDANWPRWRGPRGDNRPAVSEFPQELSKGLKRLWSVDKLCEGKNSQAWSCPSIQGERLIVTGRRGDKDVVFCLSAATGQQIWQQEYDAPGPDVQYGNGPRATPIIDGERVYTFGCMGQVACWLLADGKQVWTKAVDDLGGKRPTWGYASTPLLHGEHLLVMAGGKALVLALDRNTGQKVWASPPGQAGYAALTVVSVAGREQLVAFGAAALVGLDPKTGGLLWQLPWPTAYGMNCTTPIQLRDELLICSSEKGGTGGVGLLAVPNPDESGPETSLKADSVKLVWVNRQVGPMHNDPVVIDGCLYVYSGFSRDPKGFVCLDLANGQQKWFTDQLGGPGTVVQVAGDLLCLSNRGRLALVRPSPEGPKKLSEFQAIDGYPVWTEPIIAGGRLYVRFSSQLVCYELAR